MVEVVRVEDGSSTTVLVENDGTIRVIDSGDASVAAAAEAARAAAATSATNAAASAVAAAASAAEADAAIAALAPVATSGDYDDLTGKPNLSVYAPLDGPDFTGTVSSAGPVVINDATTSGGATTGSLVTLGGVGVGGAIFATGVISSSAQLVAPSLRSSGEGTASPGGITVRAADAGGTNIVGANTAVRAGNGTGTGGSGSLLFQTAAPGSTGAAANTLSTRFTIAPNGNATFANSLTVAGQINVGGSIVVGAGDGSASPSGTTVRAPNAIGTNLAGASLTLAGGTSTGNANGGGVVIQTAPFGSAGATQNALRNIAQFTSGGNLILGAGDLSATPASPIISAPRSGGTDIAGASISIQAGISTGNATGGSLTFISSGAGVTGSTSNPALTVATINPFGQPTFGSTAQNALVLQPGNSGSPIVLRPSTASIDTNVGIALVPRGTGALTAAIPDNTAAGGNARGANAVDLQTSRSGPSQVASGVASVISGGNANTASAQAATVAGGGANAASGYGATVSGGEGNAAGGTYSWVPGGPNGTTRGHYGRGAWASGSFSTNGDAQSGEFVLRRQTTDATATRLTADNAVPSATNTVNLPDNGVYALRFQVVARDSAGAGKAMWDGIVLARRDISPGAVNISSNGFATAAAPTIAAGVTTGWTLAVTADTTNGGVAFTVTGAAATTIRWVARISSVELVS